MITRVQAETLAGHRVQFVHSAQRGRRDGGGVLKGADPQDRNRALVEFDYANGHISHPLLDLLVLEETHEQ